MTFEPEDGVGLPRETLIVSIYFNTFIDRTQDCLHRMVLSFIHYHSVYFDGV